MNILTSESVTPGHPDKLCDQISDALLDEYLRQDPHARVAVETLATGDLIVVAGEVTADAEVDTDNVVRRVIREVGYTAETGLDSEKVEILNKVTGQSPEIALGVGHGGPQGALGAGDQGIIYGYATRASQERLALSQVAARALTDGLVSLRKSGLSLGPDGKSQVTVAETPEGPRITDVVVSAQHGEGWDLGDVRAVVHDLLLPMMYRALPVELAESSPRVLANPAGCWTFGGPGADTGLTGRKIIVDTYGGAARHGGGAFSGKDPSKVDRSAAYAARQMALSVLETCSDLHEVEIQVAYAIGQPEPVSLTITSGVSGNLKARVERDLWQVDMTPLGIIRRLDLRTPRYLETARSGHFGHKDFMWESVGSIYG